MLVSRLSRVPSVSLRFCSAFQVTCKRFYADDINEANKKFFDDLLSQIPDNFDSLDYKKLGKNNKQTNNRDENILKMIDNWKIKNENNQIKEYFKSKGFTEDYFIERGISELNCSERKIEIEELESRGISTEKLRELIPKILFEKYGISLEDIETEGLSCLILRDLGVLAPESGAVDPLRYGIAESSANLISNEERDIFQNKPKWHYDEDTIVHIKKYCHPVLRKWVEFAEGALIGRGFYDSTGKWVQYSKLDEKQREFYAARFESGTVPPITFRLVNGPDGSEVLRAMNPPYFRQKLPDDLADKYRFSIPSNVVERMQLSDKLKKVLSFSYASTREIRAQRTREIVKKWGKTTLDTGDTAVQLCVLNDRLHGLQEHIKLHTRDKFARRRLSILLSHRKSLYKYLKRKDTARYYQVIKDQVIEDTFLVQDNLIKW